VIEIEKVERISEGGATQRPRRITKCTAVARGIETRSGRSEMNGPTKASGEGTEAGTGVVVMPANGLFEMKTFESI
jgi:hypothetical protein